MLVLGRRVWGQFVRGSQRTTPKPKGLFLVRDMYQHRDLDQPILAPYDVGFPFGVLQTNPKRLWSPASFSLQTYELQKNTDFFWGGDSQIPFWVKGKPGNQKGDGGVPKMGGNETKPRGCLEIALSFRFWRVIFGGGLFRLVEGPE